MKSRREEILAHVRTIPSLPTGAIRVIRLLHDPEVDVSELTRSIEYDPILTTNLLRIANSAYFGGSRAVGSARDAIVRIGIRNLGRLLVPSMVSPLASTPIKGYALPPEALLEHCVATAIAADKLSEITGSRGRVVFTAGLLHDLGKVLLGSFLEIDGSAIRDLACRESISFEAAEARVLGIDHAEAGAALLESWNCPQEIVDAARWHHDPLRAPSRIPVVDFVHVGDALCLMEGIGMGSDGLQYRACEEAIAHWNFTEEVLEGVICSTLLELEEMKGIFEKKVEVVR